MNERILVVDDEMDILDMLKQYLSMQGYLVYTAESGKMALKLLEKEPDLILLDVNMPDMDGIELCKHIRRFIQVPVLFLTARVEEEDRVHGLLAGGDDYITKPFSLRELGARITAHLRRELRRGKKEKIACTEGFVIQYSERKVFYSGGSETGEEPKPQEIRFTRTEFDIIEILSMNSGQIFDKESIYEKLWGYGKEGDSSIITEHVRRIRSKFKEHDSKELIETVWGVGYRWIG